jgi:hypothetical protein
VQHKNHYFLSQRSPTGSLATMILRYKFYVSRLRLRIVDIIILILRLLLKMDMKGRLKIQQYAFATIRQWLSVVKLS